MCAASLSLNRCIVSRESSRQEKAVGTAKCTRKLLSLPVFQLLDDWSATAAVTGKALRYQGQREYSVGLEAEKHKRDEAATVEAEQTSKWQERDVALQVQIEKEGR